MLGSNNHSFKLHVKIYENYIKCGNVSNEENNIILKYMKSCQNDLNFGSKIDAAVIETVNSHVSFPLTFTGIFVLIWWGSLGRGFQFRCVHESAINVSIS